MKKLIILIISIVTVSNAFAQYFAPSPISIDKYTILDSAYLKIYYKLDYIKDTLNAKQISVDTQTLLIGEKLSKYYSQSYYDHNEYIKELRKKAGDGLPRANSDINGYEIFKNYPSGKITVTDLGSNLRGNFLYEDNIENVKWEISSEKTTIISYPCQKAITEFRGRLYEAWFTTDIPVNNGPWKFMGLPGLIMKVSDYQQHFIFECIGLEKLKKKEPIKYFKLDYTKISRQNLDKLYRRLHDDLAAYHLSIGGTTFEINPDTGEATETKNSTKKLPRNPIEKE